MNKIEIIICWEDTTWTTQIVDIPNEIDRSDYNAVQEWIVELYRLTEYRRAVYMGIYNESPEEDWESEDGN